MGSLTLVKTVVASNHITSEIVAISTSHSTLVDYCVEKFGEEPGDLSYDEDCEGTYLKINKSQIEIIQEKITKFN